MLAEKGNDEAVVCAYELGKAQICSDQNLNPQTARYTPERSRNQGGRRRCRLEAGY
jgi:hypothetical protein